MGKFKNQSDNWHLQTILSRVYFIFIVCGRLTTGMQVIYFTHKHKTIFPKLLLL